MNDLHAIYDILVKFAGADERDREQFMLAHTYPPGCTEFRFCGALGFGGKYRSARNAVDCYREDETPALRKVMDDTNAALAALRSKE